MYTVALPNCTALWNLNVLPQNFKMFLICHIDLTEGTSYPTALATLKTFTC